MMWWTQPYASGQRNVLYIAPFDWEQQALSFEKQGAIKLSRRCPREMFRSAFLFWTFLRICDPFQTYWENEHPSSHVAGSQSGWRMERSVKDGVNICKLHQIMGNLLSYQFHSIRARPNPTTFRWEWNGLRRWCMLIKWERSLELCCYRLLLRAKWLPRSQKNELERTFSTKIWA